MATSTQRVFDSPKQLIRTVQRISRRRGDRRTAREAAMTLRHAHVRTLEDLPLPKRPDDVTPYRWRNFVKAFASGCEMWTSEDGSLIAVAIMRQPCWKEILLKEFQSVWDHEPFVVERARLCYAEQESVGREFFDGTGRMRGKVWRIVDHATPFPVLEYELQKPR